MKNEVTRPLYRRGERFRYCAPGTQTRKAHYDGQKERDSTVKDSRKKVLKPQGKRTLNETSGKPKKGSQMRGGEK